MPYPNPQQQTKPTPDRQLLQPSKAISTLNVNADIKHVNCKAGLWRKVQVMSLQAACSTNNKTGISQQVNNLAVTGTKSCEAPNQHVMATKS